MPEIKEWTVMFYLASDNPLAPGTISHLKAIKNAGYHPEANVVAQFDPHTVNMPVHVFDVNRMEKLKFPHKVNVGFGGNDSFVRNLVADKLWDADINKEIKVALQKLLPEYEAPTVSRAMSREQNPKESLEQFLTFCRDEYPARHYILFLIGHGLAVGTDLFLMDEHGGDPKDDSSPRSLKLNELGEVLDTFNSKLNKGAQLELIGFHNCSMSGAEVALQLKGKAHYMLAAQGPAYLGSWPYQNILTRLFNDLDSAKAFGEEDLDSPDLADKLKEASDPVSQFLRSGLNGGRDLLNEHRAANPPKDELVHALCETFKGVIADPNFYQAERFQQVSLSAETRQLLEEFKKSQTSGDRYRDAFSEDRLKRLNRLLLIDAFPHEIPRVNVKKLLVSIFHYCLYNSFDFQLAGYSCDLTLCDLTKVGALQSPTAILVSRLIAGLESAERMEDPLIRDLLILAHWEAQSFFEEKYTDLYDFCFRLRTRCIEAKPSSRETQSLIDQIRDACYEVMKVLKRGTEGNDDGVIVRCEFCGPDSQYAHGLSVLFPWSEPIGDRLWDEQYANFEFSKTNWPGFLKKYFDKTMRAPQEEQEDDLDTRPVPDSFDTDLLQLLQEITTKTFNDDGQLKGGAKDPLGRAGSKDPVGSDCECASIKNYPRNSVRRLRRSEKSRPVLRLAQSFIRFFSPNPT
jgi:hypothetical protein